MPKDKDAKKREMQALQQRNSDLESQLLSSVRKAADEINKAGDVLHASAAVLTITALGGRVIIGPVAISDGLSQDTIDAIKSDLIRTWNYKTEIKPKGL